jgi:type I restriction enzyme M protein
MLTPDTKRHIDAARQVLVGVVPNPTSQIDQITNALIYKFMDDMDQAAIKAGDEPSFFVGDLERYAWSRLMDPRLGNQEKMNLYGEALIKFSESKQLPQLFRDIFRQAYLPYRQPEVLGLFLHEINFFDYSHPEELGNAYEYLLSIMSSQGDAGQFRTPRHIIDFIVEVVDPSKDDKVLDPACGTGGFLVSAYKHIASKHDGKNIDGTLNGEKPLTPDDRRKLMQNFEGYDVDPGMVRIAQVNMYLHQFKNPKIYNYNTLSSEERWNDKFDVMLANPPFMSPKGGVETHSKFSVQSSRSEVLFVDYIMNHLRPKGRAGIIVPEGIIFQSGVSYKQLRKNLVEDGLFAVVSLPSGVFNPYAGVKTSILLFDAEMGRQQKEILFVKIENDGFDLGAQRREKAGSNLPEAARVLFAWRNGEKIESKLAQWVSREKISETGDYNLSGDRYRVATDYTNAKWPMVELGEVVEILDSKRKPITKSDRKSGQFPYYGATGILDYVHDYIFDERLVLIGEDGAKWDIGDRTAFIAEGKYWVNNHAHVVRPIKNKLIDTFLVSYLNNIDLYPFITGVTVPKLNQEKLRSIKIPLPPIEIQEKIVTELDGYAGIIAGAKEIVTNWKPQIVIDSEWGKVKLGDVLQTSSGGTPLKSEAEYYEGGTIPWITSGEVSQGLISQATQFITESGVKNSSTKRFPVETILVAMYGATVGQVGILGIEATTNQAVCGIFPDPKYVPKFLYYFLRQQKEYFTRLSVGGAQPNISQNIIRNLEIPDVSIEIQSQIVKEIEYEHGLIESSEKLIGIYEQKIKEVLEKLWNK